MSVEAAELTVVAVVFVVPAVLVVVLAAVVVPVVVVAAEVEPWVLGVEQVPLPQQ